MTGNQERINNSAGKRALLLISHEKIAEINPAADHVDKVLRKLKDIFRRQTLKESYTQKPQHKPY